MVRESYHHSDDPVDIAQRLPPDFSRFGQHFQICMDDIRSENPQILRATNDFLAKEREETDSELSSSHGSGKCDVVSAVARVMKERRHQLENTNSLTETIQGSQTDEWN